MSADLYIIKGQAIRLMGIFRRYNPATLVTIQQFDLFLSLPYCPSAALCARKVAEKLLHFTDLIIRDPGKPLKFHYDSHSNISPSSTTKYLA